MEGERHYVPGHGTKSSRTTDEREETWLGKREKTNKRNVAPYRKKKK